MKAKTIFEWAELFQEDIQSGTSQSNIIQMLQEFYNEQCAINGVVVPKGTLCECWDENWAYAENGLDTYCTKCNPKD